MKDVLLVLSSPRGDESYSQRIAKQFVDALAHAQPRVRNLAPDRARDAMRAAA